MRVLRTTGRWLIAVLAIGLAACEADQAPPTAAPEPMLRTVRIDGVDLVLRPDGRRLAASFLASEVIGPAGGSIAAGAGTLLVPQGALSADTPITMEDTVDDIWKYRFGPSGLQFASPSTLEIAADPDQLGTDPGSLKVAGSDELGLEWEIIEGSGYDETRGIVTAPIHHFSQYALCVN